MLGLRASALETHWLGQHFLKGFYRKTGEHYNPEMIQEVVDRGYDNIIVWSGIINDQKTPLD